MPGFIFESPRTAGHVFHAEHQQPGGGDEEEEAAEAGEKAATVQEQGFCWHPDDDHDDTW